VFSNGTSKGLNASIPFGGQIAPISITGANAAAKKAQKNAKKNITSVTINKIIPYRKPNWTIFVCDPSKDDSRTISRHQRNIQSKTQDKPNKLVSKPKRKP